MSEDAKELKPCLHCEGGTPAIAGLDAWGSPVDLFAVKCFPGCQACGPIRESESEAADAWNTRPAIDAAVQARVEQITDEIAALCGAPFPHVVRLQNVVMRCSELQWPTAEPPTPETVPEAVKAWQALHKEDRRVVGQLLLDGDDGDGRFEAAAYALAAIGISPTGDKP